jgi:hypothetical protein
VYIACPDSALDAFGEYPSVDGAPGTVSSSRSCRRSRCSAAGFGRAATILRDGFGAFVAAFLAGTLLRRARGVDFFVFLPVVRRRADAEARRADADARRAVFAFARLRGAAFRPDLGRFRSAALLVRRADFRVRALALRFAITGVLSRAHGPGLGPECP